MSRGIALNRNGLPVGYTGATTAPPERAVSATLSLISATPVTVVQGGFSTVEVIARDEFGVPIEGVSVTLAASGSGATVVQPTLLTNAQGITTGVVTSNIPAVYAISAVAGGVAIVATASVEVIDSSELPDIEDDFSSYTDTANFRSDPRNIYDAVEEFLTTAYGNVNLDQSLGYGGRSQCMSIDYLDAAGSPTRCSGGSNARRVIQFPNGTVEAYVEIFVRFTTNFNFGGDPAWSCTSAREQKLFISGVSGGDSRFNLECTNTQWVFGYPGGETAYVSNAAPQPASMFDGEWHRIRFHYRLSSVGQGVARFWYDDTLRADLQGLTIARDGISNISLSASRNQGTPAAMSWRFGLWRVWLNGRSPGW